MVEISQMASSIIRGKALYRTQGRTSGYKKYMKQVDKHANTYGEYEYQGRIYDQRFSDVEDVIVQFYEGAQDSCYWVRDEIGQRAVVGGIRHEA